MTIFKFLAVSIVVAVLFLANCSRDFDKPPEPGVVSGQLISDQPLNQPVADARVRLLECGLSVRSDEQGNFIFNSVPDGEYTVRIDAALLEDSQAIDYSVELSAKAVVRGPSLTNLGTISVSLSGSLAGKVTIPENPVLLNTAVYVVNGDQITHTGYDGSFVLEKVPAGTRKIGASRPGYILEEPVEVEVVAGQVISLDLELQPVESASSGSVEGSVILGNPGPEPNVIVELTERFRSTKYSTITDEQGAFFLYDIPIGFYEFEAYHDGYRSVGLPNIEVRGNQTLELPSVVLPPIGTSGPQSPADQDPNGNLDDDYDGILDDLDNCPVIPNADQADNDGDGIGNSCDAGTYQTDIDADGIPNLMDNCPEIYNPIQNNHDDDPIGDECDEDIDNDGLVNLADSCPYIPDPGNDKSLCSWQLIFAGQDMQGNVHLNLFEMTTQGSSQRPLTTGIGQAWGATVYKDSVTTWVYFHALKEGAQNFEICRLDLAIAEQEPIPIEDLECFDGSRTGTGDLTNPTICSSTPAMMYYEGFDSDHHSIYYTYLDQAMPGHGQPLDLSMAHNSFPARPTSFRYPACNFLDSSKTIELGYSVDFGVDGNFMPLMPLDWNAYLIQTWASDPTAIEPIGAIDDSKYSHERRPAYGSYQFFPGWFYDRQQGLRNDILFWSQGGGQSEVVINGARNMEPTFFALPDGVNGLLAYQSDLYGSFDVFVLSLASGSAVRVTSAAGWEGSPCWLY
jgi:hypothetical protein